jgi:hypothetical protein
VPVFLSPDFLLSCSTLTDHFLSHLTLPHNRYSIDGRLRLFLFSFAFLSDHCSLSRSVDDKHRYSLLRISHDLLPFLSSSTQYLSYLLIVVVIARSILRSLGSEGGHCLLRPYCVYSLKAPSLLQRFSLRSPSNAKRFLISGFRTTSSHYAYQSSYLVTLLLMSAYRITSAYAYAIYA